jgi:hypothetical protein
VPDTSNVCEIVNIRHDIKHADIQYNDTQRISKFNSAEYRYAECRNLGNYAEVPLVNSCPCQQAAVTYNGKRSSLLQIKVSNVKNVLLDRT